MFYGSFLPLHSFPKLILFFYRFERLEPFVACFEQEFLVVMRAGLPLHELLFKKSSIVVFSLQNFFLGFTHMVQNWSVTEVVDEYSYDVFFLRFVIYNLSLFVFNGRSGLLLVKLSHLDILVWQ